MDLSYDQPVIIVIILGYSVSEAAKIQSVSKSVKSQTFLMHRALAFRAML